MSKICCTILVVMLSICSFAQTHWTKYVNNPVLAGDVGQWDQSLNYIGSVLFYNNQYHMWYNARIILGNFKLGYAVSDDGINWIKYPDNPVFEPGPTGSWDAGGYTRCGDVTMVNDTLHMWYTSEDGTWNWAIGHATSIDGVEWTRDPGNPVFTVEKENDWYYDWIEIHEVVHDGYLYHMWYVGGYYDIETSYIGHATSPDGSVWTRDPANPVISPGSPGEWDYPALAYPAAVYDGSTFHMWYCGGIWQGERLFLEIGYAYSSDGSKWTKYEQNPVLKREDAGQDSHSFHTPNVIIDSVENKFKMWYYNPGEYYFNYATSDITSGIPEYEQKEFSIYPNPSNKIITIETGVPDIYNIDITSINGQLLLNKVMVGTDFKIDLSTLQSGIYIVTIRSEDFLVTRKLVKH